jgi:flavin reductase (DIM6/NTAB) family NADH-FMN oxidoreductase RutF
LTQSIQIEERKEAAMKEMDIHSAIELGSPYPYTLVVTLDKQRKPNVMGLSWWTFTSLQPPMIGISVGHGRYTHECLESCKEFVICFPSEEQAKAAWLCGIRSGRKTDKFAAVGLATGPSRVVGPPVIEGATLAYECKVVGQLECSDHTLFNGEVVGVHGDPQRAKHLYSIHYSKLISIDYKGNLDMNIEYK